MPPGPAVLARTRRDLDCLPEGEDMFAVVLQIGCHAGEDMPQSRVVPDVHAPPVLALQVVGDGNSPVIAKGDQAFVE